MEGMERRETLQYCKLNNSYDLSTGEGGESRFFSLCSRGGILAGEWICSILDGYTRFKPISLDKCCSIVVISYTLLLTSRMHCPIVLHGQFEFGRLHDGPVEGWSKKKAYLGSNFQ